MERKLKIMNGRSPNDKFGRGAHVYVAYTTLKEAELMMQKAFETMQSFSGEFREYWSKDAWGNTMEGITPIEPCVYISTGGWKGTPERVL